MPVVAHAATVQWPPPAGAPLTDPRARHCPPKTSFRAPALHAAVPSPSTSQFLVLVPIRVFLAIGWLRAGIEKLIAPKWWSGENLREFLDVHRTTAIAPFRPVMEHVFEPMALLVAFVVVATEIGCGIAIGTGTALRGALRWAVVLNVVFMLCGPVNPSAFYLVMEMVLLTAIADGTIGTRPTSPSNRTVTFACALLLTALLMTPYIRTIDPAKVIADPAIMLVFLAALQAVTLLLRFAMSRASWKEFRSTSVASQRLLEWMRARPRTEPRSSAAWATRHTAPNVVPSVGWKRSE